MGLQRELSPLIEEFLNLALTTHVYAFVEFSDVLKRSASRYETEYRSPLS
jgi:hypothetical protein